MSEPNELASLPPMPRGLSALMSDLKAPLRKVSSTGTAPGGLVPGGLGARGGRVGVGLRG